MEAAKLFRNRYIFAFCFILCCMLIVNACNVQNKAQKEQVIVSAAASLNVFLDEAVAQFEEEHPEIDVNINYGSSGALQKQIEQGAPVDLYLSASQQQMDKLKEQELILQSDRLVQNSLVVIAPKGLHAYQASPDLAQWLQQVNPEYIAIGEPGSVPAGVYAKQALEFKQIWNDWENRFVYSKDVRQVLTYVEQKNAAAGIVYASDALSSNQVDIVYEIPEAWHDAIIYEIGIVENTAHKEAALKLYQYLLQDKMNSMYKSYGFKKVER